MCGSSHRGAAGAGDIDGDGGPVADPAGIDGASGAAGAARASVTEPVGQQAPLTASAGPGQQRIWASMTPERQLAGTSQNSPEKPGPQEQKLGPPPRDSQAPLPKQSPLGPQPVQSEPQGVLEAGLGAPDSRHSWSSIIWP